MLNNARKIREDRLMRCNFLPKPMLKFLRVLLWVSVVCHLLVGPFLVYFAKISLRMLVMALLTDLWLLSFYLQSIGKDGSKGGRRA